MTLVRYDRALTEHERDVFAVAGEMVRAQHDERIPEDVARSMASWAMRLRAAHDALLASLRLPPVHTHGCPADVEGAACDERDDLAHPERVTPA